MHRINSKISGWISLFSITIVLSMFWQSCFPQDEGGKNSETKTVSITASVAAPPPGVTLKYALEKFPESIAFEYEYMQKTFTTRTEPFTVEQTLSEEVNVTIQTNEGLKHEDQENVKQELRPVLIVGNQQPIKTANDSAKWCGAGETPAIITFGIQDSDVVPAEGNYFGEMVVVFEPASK